MNAVSRRRIIIVHVRRILIFNHSNGIALKFGGGGKQIKFVNLKDVTDAKVSRYTMITQEQVTPL